MSLLIELSDNFGVAPSAIKALYIKRDSDNKIVLYDQKSFSKKEFALLNDM